MDLKEIVELIKQAVELNKQLEIIENKLDKLCYTPVVLNQDRDKRYGHLLSINTETGIMTIDFGLKSATDYIVGYYHFNDILSEKIMFGDY